MKWDIAVDNMDRKKQLKEQYKQMKTETSQATEIPELLSEIDALRLEGKALLERLEKAQSEENTISATIVNAQKMADAIISDAKEKASSIRDTVSDSCDRILDAYVSRVAVERDKLDKTEKAVADFKNSLFDAYKEHIALIDNIMPDEEPTPYLSDEELENKAVELAKDKMESAAHSDIDVPELHPEDKKPGENGAEKSDKAEKTE